MSAQCDFLKGYFVVKKLVLNILLKDIVEQQFFLSHLKIVKDVTKEILRRNLI